MDRLTRGREAVVAAVIAVTGILQRPVQST
jgi:hypothetical protein